MGTTQAVVSRLEDPDYGRVTFKTMVALANVFDVAPVLKFISTLDLMRDRWVIRRESLEVPTFEEEAARIAFDDGATLASPTYKVLHMTFSRPEIVTRTIPTRTESAGALVARSTVEG